MIVSFRCKHTQHLFETGRSADFAAVASVAMRKLAQLDAAVSLGFLRATPGNRLEALQGSRRGQHSIRVNDQYRICFAWTAAGPSQVEFVDYHS